MIEIIIELALIIVIGANTIEYVRMIRSNKEVIGIAEEMIKNKKILNTHCNEMICKANEAILKSKEATDIGIEVLNRYDKHIEKSIIYEKEIDRLINIVYGTKKNRIRRKNIKRIINVGREEV